VNSAIYSGRVIHERFKPQAHKFQYKLMMLYLDLDEIGKIFNNIPFWRDDGGRSLAYFNRRDYMSPDEENLKKVVQDAIREQLNISHEGPIRVLTNIRMFGYCFNPVTFYYCFSKDDSKLEFVVAQITNTPWNERHNYVIDTRDSSNMEFMKQFHVSPFLDMNLQYDWFFSHPCEMLKVKMKVADNQDFLRVNLFLRKKPITSINMLKFLVYYGCSNYNTVFGIYFQALKLYFKKVPFYSHPDKREKL
jgi:uncharacterized protein